MSNLTPAEERDASRCESFRASQKRGVFVDEFGRENPQVSMGSCRPATKGPLAGRCSSGGLCKASCSKRKDKDRVRKTDNSNLGTIINAMMGGSANENKKATS